MSALTTLSLGARTLELCFAGKDPPEIARILTAEHGKHGQPITPDEARELYQTEFRNRRIAR
ncbi:hypothetical protein [Jiella sp. M17.18]|uniref:hypothetical protein n=1 Tax=Jiella sp. M17.18 TaxID=3234247 RepID=UPI0034E00358